MLLGVVCGFSGGLSPAAFKLQNSDFAEERVHSTSRQVKSCKMSLFHTFVTADFYTNRHSNLFIALETYIVEDVYRRGTGD